MLLSADNVRQASELLSHIDVSSSLGLIASERNYCRAVINERYPFP